MFPDPLRSFQTVVQAGSMRKAGELLDQAPSSISRQIATLERQVGTKLFIRSPNNGLELTHAGQMMAEYADSVIMGFDSLRADFDDVRGCHRLIKVAMVESVVSAGPTHALQLFRKSHPSVSFEFHLMIAQDVINAVRGHKYDIGVTFCSEEEPGIDMIERVIEPVVVLVQTEHPLATAASLKLQDIIAYPLALPSQEFGIRRTFNRTCFELDVACHPVLETNTFEALRDFVRIGAGIAVLPLRATVREEEAGRARAIVLDHPAFTRTTFDIIVLKQRRTPRLIRRFSQALAASIRDSPCSTPRQPPPSTTGVAARATGLS